VTSVFCSMQFIFQEEVLRREGEEDAGDDVVVGTGETDRALPQQNVNVTKKASFLTRVVLVKMIVSEKKKSLSHPLLESKSRSNRK